MRRLLILSAATLAAVALLFGSGWLMSDGMAYSSPSEAPTARTPAEVSSVQVADMADECAKHMAQTPGMLKVTPEQMRSMMNGMMGSMMMPGGNMMPMNPR